MLNRYIPDYLVTPGEVLESYLEHAGLTQTSLAERTGLAKKTINEIIKAKSAITPETALLFERTLNRPAHFWSNLERQYKEDKIRLADKIQLEKHLDWLKHFPISKMVKLGWIEKSNIKIQQLESLLHFFAVASPEVWKNIWGRELHVDFRKTESSNKNIGVISAWLRQGEIVAQTRNCAQFNKDKFKNSLKEIRNLTTEEPNIFIPKLEAICAACGVAIVFVPALSKLGIYGATRWFNNKYIMQLSLYGKSNDQLWFTIFHEACHILKHSNRELFIEGDRPENETEKEADIFAQDILIPPEKLKQFIALHYKPGIYEIEQFAKEIGIAPGIVVGRLQRDSVIPWSWGNKFKVRYEWRGGDEKENT